MHRIVETPKFHLLPTSFKFFSKSELGGTQKKILLATYVYTYSVKSHLQKKKEKHKPVCKINAT